MTLVTEPRVCLLLGAGGRLGRSFCRYLSHRYQIAAVYRTTAPSAGCQYEEVIDPLNPESPVRERRTAFYPIAADLAAEGSADRIVDLALAAFGQVDLVVNAAVRYEWGSALSPAFVTGLPQQLIVNLARPLEVIACLYQRAWRSSVADNRRFNRNIVNISSVSGARVYQGGQLGYSAAKAALNIATQHLAAELAPVCVRANAVAPNAFPGIVSFEEVLAALCDLDAGSSTGEIRVVDR